MDPAGLEIVKVDFVQVGPFAPDVELGMEQNIALVAQGLMHGSKLPAIGRDAGSPLHHDVPSLNEYPFHSVVHSRSSPEAPTRAALWAPLPRSSGVSGSSAQ